MLSKESEHAHRMSVRAASLTKIGVHSNEYVDAIHLDNWACTYCWWELLGIPYLHDTLEERSQSI